MSRRSEPDEESYDSTKSLFGQGYLAKQNVNASASVTLPNLIFFPLPCPLHPRRRLLILPNLMPQLMLIICSRRCPTTPSMGRENFRKFVDSWTYTRVLTFMLGRIVLSGLTK
jgi:hypothetical protein